MSACSLLNRSNNSITPLFGLVPEVGIAPTSPPLQGGANLPQLLGGTDNWIDGLVAAWIDGQKQAPAGSARGPLQETLVLCRCDPVRVPGAHVNSFSACAEDLLDQVRLTRAATKRFIAQNE